MSGRWAADGDGARRGGHPGVLLGRPHAAGGVGDAGAGGAVTVAPTARAVEATPAAQAITPTERVARFRAMVSPDAYELAVFLSVPDRSPCRSCGWCSGPCCRAPARRNWRVLRRRVDSSRGRREDRRRGACYRFVDGVRDELTRSLRYGEGAITAQLRVGRFLLQGRARRQRPMRTFRRRAAGTGSRNRPAVRERVEGGADGARGEVGSGAVPVSAAQPAVASVPHSGSRRNARLGVRCSACFGGGRRIAGQRSNARHGHPRARLEGDGPDGVVYTLDAPGRRMEHRGTVCCRPAASPVAAVPARRALNLRRSAACCCRKTSCAR